MRLLINTASTRVGGSVQVATSFINECCYHQDHDFGVILSEGLTRIINTSSFPPNFKFYKSYRRPGTVPIKALKGDLFSEFEQDFRPDCVFTTSGPSYWRPKAPHLMGFNRGHYIYPDSPYFKIIPWKQRVLWDLKRSLMRYFFRRDADALVVQTDDVKLRVQKYLGIDDVTTVSNTCGNQYEKDVLPYKGLPERKAGEVRLLCLAAFYDHKNIRIISDVLHELKKAGKNCFTFVLTINENEFNSEFDHDARSNIVNVGSVDFLDAPGLYKSVDFMFLPTLLECFSASYVEAMKMEIPIITSDLCFSRIVCGDGAIYFDPLDSKDIATKIIMLSQSVELQRDMIEKNRIRLKQFNTAEKRAAEYLRICRRLCSR